MPHPLSDLDIRPALKARILGEHRDPATRVISELGLCRGTVRVDLAAVNGLLHGYEIKSDRDSLRRLDRQVEVYGRVFDRATLAVGERHLDAALARLPSWWEVLVVSGEACAHLTQVRVGATNPGVDARTLVELLWLRDAVALLDTRGLARGVRGKPRWVVWDRVCEHFTLDEIGRAVRAHLKTAAAD